MDTINKNPNDFKNKPCVKYPDDDSKPSTSGYNNRYQDKNLCDLKRNETKKRSRSPEGNQDCNLVDRKKVNYENSVQFENENQSYFSSIDQFLHQPGTLPHHQNITQMPQRNMYSNFSYNGPKHYNVESNQGNYLMVSNVNEFNSYTSMTKYIYGMNNLAPYPMYVYNNVAALPVKSKTTLTNCTLFPPHPGTRIRACKRHPDCKTVFVGGLPKNITEQLIREIFGYCGKIAIVHMKSKTFCHVRFVSIESVDHAMMLSEYRLRIGEQDGSGSSGHIHRNRDDEHEWACLHRAGERKTQHRISIESVDHAMMLSEYRLRIGEQDGSGSSGHIHRNRDDEHEWACLHCAGERKTQHRISIESVDHAMMLSEYRLRIGEQDGSGSSGHIHRNRDDEHEWACLHRAGERKTQHRECLEQEAVRPSTPHVVYSEHETNLLSDRLKNEETLKEAMHVLVTWLDKGECNRRTCDNFYSMIQCTYSHGKRLINEKNKLDEELNKTKLLLQEKMSAISLQFSEIRKFYDLIKLPNIWDTFNKTQKKNIDNVRQTTLDIVGAHSAELVEDEMELRDDDCVAEGPVDSLQYQDSVKKEEVEKIKAEIAVARNQLQSFLKETVAIQRENEKNNIIRNALLKERKKEIQSKKVERDRLRKKKVYLTSHSTNEIAQNSQESVNDWNRNQSNNSLNINQDDILLITLITSFLIVHPFGASIHYICSYLQKHDPKINDHYIENLLQQYSNVFQEKISGIGTTLTKNWVFKGIQY